MLGDLHLEQDTARKVRYEKVNNRVATSANIMGCERSNRITNIVYLSFAHIKLHA